MPTDEQCEKIVKEIKEYSSKLEELLKILKRDFCSDIQITITSEGTRLKNDTVLYCEPLDNDAII